MEWVVSFRLSLPTSIVEFLVLTLFFLTLSFLTLCFFTLFFFDFLHLQSRFQVSRFHRQGFARAVAIYFDGHEFVDGHASFHR